MNQTTNQAHRNRMAWDWGFVWWCLMGLMTAVIILVGLGTVIWALRQAVAYVTGL